MTRIEYEIELHRLLAEHPEHAKVLESAIQLFAENERLREAAAAARSLEEDAYRDRDAAIALRDEVLEIGTWNAAMNAVQQEIRDYPVNPYAKSLQRRLNRLLTRKPDTELAPAETPAASPCAR